jgi:hypothetical protein
MSHPKVGAAEATVAYIQAYYFPDIIISSSSKYKGCYEV